jgi:hypothetical protein
MAEIEGERVREILIKPDKTNPFNKLFRLIQVNLVASAASYLFYLFS